jgi:hypothetical protein
MYEQFIDKIRQANLERSKTTLTRRLVKVMEELGEASEAHLNVTSDHNSKNMTVDDVTEELLDMVIVGVDCLLTPLDGSDPSEQEAKIMALLDCKLAKWEAHKVAQAFRGKVDDAL